MDAAAFGLAQAQYEWNKSSNDRPSFLILASPGASNQTDRAFSQSGASSPQKFVHTLPSVRCSPLCQILDWSGPMLCLNQDPETILLALREAADLADLINEGHSQVWVYSVTAYEGRHAAHCFKIGGQALRKWALRKKTTVCASEKPNAKNDAKNEMNDRDFIDWLLGDQSGNSVFLLPGGYELRKN
jgi:hypothetical protein